MEVARSRLKDLGGMCLPTLGIRAQGVCLWATIYQALYLQATREEPSLRFRLKTAQSSPDSNASATLRPKVGICILRARGLEETLYHGPAPLLVRVGPKR